MTTDSMIALTLSVQAHRRDLMADAEAHRIARSARRGRAQRRAPGSTDGGC